MIKIGESFILKAFLNDSSLKPINMLWINPGTFLMGSPADEVGRDDFYDFEPVSMTLSHGFWLGQYLVTQAQWVDHMSTNPSKFTYSPNCPVENVNWFSAIAFCEALNAHYVDLLPKDYYFSLPTDVQWEYACRAGASTSFYNGNNPNLIGEIAWHKDNSNNMTHPVGEKHPNEWELYDMIGNVSEWVYDSYEYLPSEGGVDWVCERKLYDGFRVIRSGSCAETIRSGNRCSSRSDCPARMKSSGIGFRIALRYCGGSALHKSQEIGFVK